MNCSEGMQEYFDQLEKDTKEAYKFADRARKKGGVDPENQVQVQLARTLADRVIGLISVVAPQLEDSKAPERIDELEEKYGVLDWRVAFKIAEDVAREKFCEFESEKEAIETGIRVGFAYITLGVVSSPIEGLTELEIKDRRDGEGQYFCLNYSGPVRNAGGTAASVSVLIGDYLRKQFGYEKYDPTEKEIKRCHEELRDYHEKVTNLQYYPSKEESDFMMENLPVEIGGEPSERYEVSNFNVKDLDRIPTDVIRSGYCLIHSSCLPLKAPKIWKRFQKWGHEFDMEQWDWIEKFLKIQKEQKAGGDNSEEKTEKKISPDYTYIKDLVSGRPVLGHPLRDGGFRIRYGRGRNTGLSATGMHPATMVLTDDFIGVGTQLKTERPGKAASVNACDTIMGPIVKLKDGSVEQVDDPKRAKEIRQDVAEILYMGDMLINYGDFFDRAHSLVPVGYCEEWWSQEVEKAAEEMFGEKSLEKISNLTEVNEKKVEQLLKNPTETNASFEEAKKISENMDVPLHPQHTYFWQSIQSEQLQEMIKWISDGKLLEDGKLRLELDDAKRILELLGVEHLVVNQEYVVVEQPAALLYQLDMSSLEMPALTQTKDTLDLINNLCDLTIRDKGGTFMGARMGRPEKAKMRKLKGSPHGLFPVGEEGGRLRSVNAAMDEGYIKAQYRIHKCPSCEQVQPYSICIDCQTETDKMQECEKCGLVENCSHEDVRTYKTFEIDIEKYFNTCLDLLDTKIYPDVIKGVRGTSSKHHDSEHLAKGILRAHHGIHVNKDGTTRYDCSELPLTHFKPKEINVSVEELKNLGYEKDIHGEPLQSKEQVVELKPQDVVLPCSPDNPEEPCDEILYRSSKFIDDALQKLYDENPYYELDSKEDLVGHYVIGLAPHTSAGMVGRIIGFSQTQGLLAHPLFHSAMRRDCDGDEACLLLLMDAFLNFSPNYLPDSRGGTMDAPLVLTYHLIPEEVDDMVFNMDITSKYPLELYEAAQEYKDPWDVDVEVLEKVLGESEQFEGMKFTHDTSSINSGVLCSSYKTLPSMEEKLKGQMGLSAKIRAVDKKDVAKLVIERHFIRDTKGNLKKFSQQEFRCVQCNTKYRRPPLKGNCEECNGRIIFTISEGSITKYMEPSISLAEEFEVPTYLAQSLDLLKRRVEEVFGKEDERQEELKQWFK